MSVTRSNLRDRAYDVHSSVSDTIEIGMRLPQGSIQGPILFIRIINDISTAIGLKWLLSLYADDSYFILSAPISSDLEIN